NLNGIYFVDSNTGWAVGDRATILTTRDGGTTWYSQTSPNIENLNGIYFVDPNTGWAVGDGGTILTTNDGGTTWGSQISPIQEKLKVVYFVNPNTGWAVGDNAGDHGAILKYSEFCYWSGDLISVEIKPDYLAGWDKFYANTTLQEGTDITFSILNATNSTLISGITATQAKEGYDISSISIANTSIRLYALLYRANGSNTPLLHDWSVSWSTDGVAPTITTDTPIQQSVFSDENANYTIIIKNNGTLRDVFYLTVESTADTAEMTNDLVQLDAGASTNIKLTVRDSENGTYITTITGTSTGNTSKNSSLTVITGVSTADIYGVSISSDKSFQSVERNENALYILTIKNTGNQEDTYTLSESTQKGITAYLNTSTVTIPAGGSANVILNVYGLTPKKNHLTQITASSSYSNASASVQVHTTVIKALSLRVDTLKLSVNINENATYILTLKNIGNIQHTYNLSATGIGQLSATTITLDVGESSEIKLNVSSATTGSYVMTVTASTITAGGVEDKDTKKMTLTVGKAQVYGVALSVDETSKFVNQSEKASYILTIKNTGNQPDTYDLILINPRADTATISADSISELSAGGSETILLNVSDSEGGRYEVEVISESKTDPEKSDTVKTTTYVLNHGVVMTADATSKTASTGDMLTYAITIENTGNTADTFDLTLSKQSELDFAYVSTNSISLASGATGEVVLSVKGSAGTYWARVNATSQGNSNKMDSIKFTATFQEEDKYGVGMFISPASREIEKNDDVVYTITVMNIGNREDTYNLTTTLGTLGTNSLTVPAGDTKSTTLTVSGTEIKTYTSIVTVASSHASDTKSVSTIIVPAVSLKAAPSSKILYLGNESSFTIMIENTGVTYHTYDLSVTNTSDIVDLSTTSISLEKGDSADVTLTMNDSSDGMYTAVVTVTDRDDTTQNASITVSMLYLEETLYGVDLRIDAEKKTIEPGKYALYVLTITNLGNTQDTFNLNITLNETKAILSKYSVSLQPSGTIGDSATIKLNVTSAVVGEFVVNVKAVSQNDSSISDIIKTTTKVAGNTGTNNIINSKVDEVSTIINSTIIRSTIVSSLITTSTITDSQITDSSIYNSTINGTALKDIKLENATVNAGNITSGKIKIEDTIYEISEEIPISDIVTYTGKEDSSLAGKEGDITEIDLGANSAIFTIGNNKSYVGGSLKIQDSSVPNTGTTRISLGTGEYINIEASDNLKASMGWVIIKTTYDESKLGGIGEERLRLYYYDEANNTWVRLVSAGNPSWCYGAGVNTEENYVWANVSHFSDYGNGGGGEVPEQPSGGVLVDILPSTQNVNATTEPCKNFTLRITNTQNFDDVIDFEITLSGIPPEYQANLSWFNWTAGSIDVPSGESKDVGLMVNISSDPKDLGMYYFKIVAEYMSGSYIDTGVVNIV
ncbi:hypothetical protein ACFLY8_05155, partial [Halobacteriota archaeon]